MLIGRTDAEAPIFWPPVAKSWPLEKTPMLGKIEDSRRSGWQRIRWLDNITKRIKKNHNRILLLCCAYLLNHVQLFVTPWTPACQATLSFTISWCFAQLMPTDSVMPSNQLILCHPSSSCPQSFPAWGSFPVSQLFASGGQSPGASASAPVLPVNIQGWFPLGLTGWISLQSKGLSKVFSSTTIPRYQLFHAQPSSWSSSHIHTWLLEKL